MMYSQSLQRERCGDGFLFDVPYVFDELRLSEAVEVHGLFAVFGQSAERRTRGRLGSLGREGLEQRLVHYLPVILLFITI